MGGGYGGYDGPPVGGGPGVPRGKMGKFVVKAKGLPFRVSERDIAEWFSDVAYPIDVRIEYNEDGRPSGDAAVTFATAQEAIKAATKNKQHMQHRYIEIFFVRHILKMRGLPFRATEQDIAEWFTPIADPLDVQIDIGEDGRPTGDAKVMFATEDEAYMAMKKNKQYMQHRYVELQYEGPDYSRPGR